ncbi:hypothetical protein EGH24_04455 [Halonotius terrestris]|uniref:Winged helix-turn-helix DNA-binding n=1 Tax=Halonotius terrestris TaxID=2487750 RepID=A0A8J8PCY1_9EURY|nr:hypothetical protein [Halonotius terrestris]TQQ82703.1 hypothetical protein EGH24_04455 [Halonotius terrestris]
MSDDDSASLSSAQEAIIQVASENPKLTNAEIAEETGNRLTLVRDTIAAHGDQIETRDVPSEGSKPIDSASFNETESAVLEAALRNPEATNAEIATSVGTHVGLVRDIRAEYEDVATLPDAEASSSDASAGGMEFDTELLSAAQEEILRVARENPESTNAEIAEETDSRLTLVRDTIANHGDSISTGSGRSGGTKPIDSASFNETEAAVLEAALRNPNATNAAIAEHAGTHVGLVRDIRDQYEDIATLPDDDSTAAADESAADAPDVDTEGLSAAQQAILETAAAHPALTNAEIAEETGNRLPLVRDTLAEHYDPDTASSEAASGDSSSTASATDIQHKIINLAEENPELTNSEIADEIGARLTLVRDTLRNREVATAS